MKLKMWIRASLGTSESGVPMLDFEEELREPSCLHFVDLGVVSIVGALNANVNCLGVAMCRQFG